MPNLRNLLRRPAKPAAGNGRVQRGVERALIAHNGGPITTSTAAEWAYALRCYQGKPIKSQHLVCTAAEWAYALRCYQGKPIKSQHLVYVRRGLDRVADRVRKVPPYGAWLWRLKGTDN
jgi:hypothetical protein